MANFFGWTLVYVIKLIVVVLFSAAGIAIGVSLRKRKDKKTQD